jgi:hypothetical protein
MKLPVEKPNPPISLKEINEFEKEFNLIIPEAYKEFLLVNNGGICDSNMYYDTALDFVPEILIEKFYSLSEIADFLRLIGKTKTIKVATGVVEMHLGDFPKYCIDNGAMMIGVHDQEEISIGIRDNTFGQVFYSVYGESVEFELISQNFDEFINNFNNDIFSKGN